MVGVESGSGRIVNPGGEAVSSIPNKNHKSSMTASGALYWTSDCCRQFSRNLVISSTIGVPHVIVIGSTLVVPFLAVLHPIDVLVPGVCALRHDVRHDS